MIRFDTGDKKPTLYNLLVLTGIVFVIVGWLLSNTGTDPAVVSVIVEVYFAAALICQKCRI